MSGTGTPAYRGKLARLPAHRLNSLPTDEDRTTAAREYMPEALESETTLLALALDTLDSVREPAQAIVTMIAATKFWDHRNRAVALAMYRLEGRGEAINPVTVFDELKRMDEVGDGKSFPMLADFHAQYPQVPMAFTYDPQTYAQAIHRAYADRLTIEWAGKLAQIGARHVPGELASALQMMQLELSLAERDADGDSAAARLRFVSLDDLLSRERSKMLDPEIGLRERQLALVFGASNSGKSLYVLMRLVFMAAGRLSPEPLHVGYLCGEGLDGIRDRLMGIILRFGLDQQVVTEHFHILPDVPQLASSEDVLATVLAARELDEPLVIVAIDTLATATEGLNENASDEMGAALGGVRHLAKELDCAMLLVHHVGKDTTRGSRGWTGLPGKMDVCVEVSRIEGSDIVNLRCTKMRDGEYFPDVAYRILPFALDDYAEVKTAVLETTTADNAARAIKRLSAGQQQVWDILAESGREGRRYTEFMNICKIRGINENAFKSAFKVLKETGRLDRDGHGGWIALTEPPESTDATDDTTADVGV